MQDDKIYDVIVIGVGIYGASILYHAAQTNLEVLALEQYELYNEKGSSYGETRITRQNVFEGIVYPKIAKEGQKIIKDLEKQTNQQLQNFAGGLYCGLPNSEAIQGILRNEKANNLKPEILTSQQIKERFKIFDLPESFVGVIEHTAGFAYVDKIKQSLLNIAQKSKNITIKTQAKLQKFVQKTNYLEITTTDNRVFKAKKMIQCQGIGMAPILRKFGFPIRIQKNQAAWLDWNDKEVQPQNLPIFYIEYYQQKHIIYGFPNVGTGLKIGLHRRGQEYIDDKDVTFDTSNEIMQELQQKSSEVMPTIQWNKRKVNTIKPCCYTYTYDGDFVLDFHPENENIVLASCCSGHGFKYAPILGKTILEMTQNGKVPYQEFRINRFQQRPKL